MSQQTAQYPTIRMEPFKVQALIACEEADKLPWWAFIRRQGWIATARGLRRMHEIGAGP